MITRENGFGQFFAESGHMLVAFSLFNPQKQYGILLCKIGRVLAEAMGENALTARIGGDEFVSVIFGEVKAEELAADIRAKCAAYNESSCKPYLVESSVGIVEFICKKEMDTGSLFEQAEQIMYKVKKQRRKSVIRAKVIQDSSDKYYS